MDFEVHCMSILHTKLSFFNYDKVQSGLQSMTPLWDRIAQFLNFDATMWLPHTGNKGVAQEEAH